MSLQLFPSTRPSVRPSVRKNTVILPVYAGPVTSEAVGLLRVAKLCKCNGARWPLAKQACILARIPSSAFSKSEGGGTRCPPLLSVELETQTSSLSRGRSKRFRKLQKITFGCYKSVCGLPSVWVTPWPR